MKVALAILRTTLGVIGPDTVDNLAHGLMKNNNKVTLITAKTSVQPTYQKIHYCPFSWSNLKLPLCLIYFIKNVRKIAKENDIVQLYLPSPLFAFIGDLISFKNKTSIVTVFESSLIDKEQKIKGLIKKSPLFYLTRLLMNNFCLAKLTSFSCAAYIVSSHYQKSQLLSLNYPAKKILVIPNLIDTDKYVKLNNIEAKKKYNLVGQFIISYIGHLTHNKGVDLLVKAFSRIVKDIPEARLVIAWSQLALGKHKIKSIIKEEGCKDKVIFLGEVNVPTLLSATDIMVLPYQVTFATQLFPSTLLETMSVGVPLITTNLKPLDEIIKDKETALLVPSGNHQKIAEAILELFKNKELAKEMVLNQQELIRQKFNQQDIIQKYLELYKSLQYG